MSAARAFAAALSATGAARYEDDRRPARSAAGGMAAFVLGRGGVSWR
ncbi:MULTISPECIES: hypothetical protein [Prauserella]|nr:MULTISPECIES: hypothetical protein [Prauserella]